MKKHLIVLAALTFFPVFSPGHASTNLGGSDDCGSGLLNLGDGSSGSGCGGRHLGGGGLRAFGEGGAGCDSGIPLVSGEGGSGCGNGARPSLR